MSNGWGRKNEKIVINNVPTILPPDIDAPLLHAVLLRSQLEEIQYNLTRLVKQSRELMKNSFPKGRGHDTIKSIIEKRDNYFSDRKILLDSIDKIYPAFRCPAAMRISNSKVTQKYDIPYEKVGLILGPRGETQKMIEAKYKVKISIRGLPAQGTSKVIQPQNTGDSPHVIIESETVSAIEDCIRFIETIVSSVSDKENYLKQAQLRQLAMYKGVVSADSAFEPTVEYGFPPWYDPTINTNISAEISDAVHKIISDEPVEEKNQEPNVSPTILRCLINLTEDDLSMLLPQRTPPGGGMHWDTF